MKKKTISVCIASLTKDNFYKLVQELLKIFQEYKNVVVYTTLLDKKEQELAFAALELGIPYYIFIFEDDVQEYKKFFSSREWNKFMWLYVRAEKVIKLPKDKHIKNIFTLQKKIIKKCDIVLRI